MQLVLGARRNVLRSDRGDWFDALPPEHEGDFDVIVSNPPYVRTEEVLPSVVAEWEPADALFAGPTGLEDAEVLLGGAQRWLRSGGALVLELGDTQLEEASRRAIAHGYVDVVVHQDLAEKDRALVARKP